HLIHKLVEKAISEGILERQDGRSIEHWFSYEIVEGVDMRGMIDIMNPGEIQDHKSTKDMKWAKQENEFNEHSVTGKLFPNPDYLGTDVQVLNYAHVLLMAQPNWSGDVTVRHNVYCKNPDKLEVRKVETTVSQKAIRENHMSLVTIAEEMVELRETGPELENWIEVEGPSAPGACGAFGGCPMRLICGFKQTPEAYIKRVERQIKNHDPREKPTTWAERWGRLDETTDKLTKDKDMSKPDIFAKQRAKKAAPAAPAATEAVVAPQIDGSQAPPDDGTGSSEAPSEPSRALPWAFSGCKACGTSATPGLNTNGNPCFICRSLNKKAGNRTDHDYVIERDPDGTLNWEATDGSGQGQASLPATSEPKVSSKQKLTPATVTPIEDVKSAIDGANEEAANVEHNKAMRRADTVLPEPKSDEDKAAEKVARAEKAREARKVKAAAKKAAEAVPNGPNVSGDEEEEKPKPKGRQPRGYRVYVDCMPLGTKTALAEVLFADMAVLMAESQGVPSYYDINPFDRRDLWHKVPEGEFQEQFGSVDIVTRDPSGSPDLKAFVEALIAAAKPGHVVQGMS
ncbi:MAG: hypothetical protein V3S98_07920, partial [Dehalococcoidia bacterium]